VQDKIECRAPPSRGRSPAGRCERTMPARSQHDGEDVSAGLQSSVTRPLWAGFPSDNRTSCTSDEPYNIARLLDSNDFSAFLPPILANIRPLYDHPSYPPSQHFCLVHGSSYDGKSMTSVPTRRHDAHIHTWRSPTCRSPRVTDQHQQPVNPAIQGDHQFSCRCVVPDQSVLPSSMTIVRGSSTWTHA
jgi:hypothetical protein